MEETEEGGWNKDSKDLSFLSPLKSKALGRLKPESNPNHFLAHCKLLLKCSAKISVFRPFGDPLRLVLCVFQS